MAIKRIYLITMFQFSVRHVRSGLIEDKHLFHELMSDNVPCTETIVISRLIALINQLYIKAAFGETLLAQFSAENL